MSELLCRPEQASNESLVGYLRRLALCNGYTGWRDLVRAVGFKPTKAVLEHDVSAIMRSMGLSTNDVISSFSSKPPAPLRSNIFVRPKYEPVCVHCLRVAEQLRREWTHCLVVACPDHQCQLVDRCPNCNEMLENSRIGIAICDCGFDLRFATTLEATPMQCWSSARISGDMRPIELIEEIGGKEDYRHLANLLFQLGTRFDPKSKIRPGSSTRPKTVQDAVELLQPVLTIFEDARSRLGAHIATRFAAGNQNAFNLSGRLGAWYTALDVVCRKQGAFPIIWEIFSDAVFENFDGLIRGQTGLTPSPGKKRQYLGVGEAAKFMGVSKPVLQNAIEKKLISVRTGREGISYAVHMIPLEQCEAILHSRSNLMSMSAGADFLAIPRSILQHLINADIVTVDSDWEKSIFKGGPINKVQLTKIIDQMSGAIQARDCKKTLRLDQINARRTVDLKALCRLYQAIFSGELRPIGREDDAGLAGLIFAADEVMQYLGTAACENALTLPQLAAATGWKYHTVSGWAKQNLLESDLVVLQGQSARIVTMENFVRFRKEWIPVSEIASAVGSKSSAVSKHLAAHGILVSGQTQEKNGASRGGLIRLSDLGLLAGLSSCKRLTRREPKIQA